MGALPEGTVSLLFSDMEGSTRLLRRLGPKYPAALDEQRRILRAAWAAHGGIELGTEGDSFYVVFSRAPDAVEAAVDAQRGLASASWPHSEEVRVRMGIHTGSPLRHHDDYVGMDVHRAARIAAAAQGGQVLVSDATAALLHLSGIELRDLGRHALKDLAQPEHLFQVLADGLESRFPPIRSLGSTSNLPRPATALVGREELLSRLEDVLTGPGARLVTLTGPGGSGKTRLAIAVAEAAAARYTDGVYFVALETVTTADGMWAALAAALDLPPEGRVPPALYDRIATWSALLVLDNLEQLEDADLVVTDLLRVAPAMRLVATSRHPLHVTGERELPVPPLDLPARHPSSGVDLDATRRSGAVAMFVAQVQLVRPEFHVDDSNVAAVLSICERLDGLPLALELAAARARLLPPAALLARLDTALDFSSRDRTRATRQRTLRETLRWSYDLLGEDERRLFRVLGVFSGGAGIDAIQAVAAGSGADADRVLDDLESLVEASLVTVTEDPEGEPRVTVLNTILAFAAGELAQADESAQVEAIAARYFTDLVVRFD
ncbi:MAG: ATP-binding protein, partial [Nocardioidaceae bacterium]